jgi:hypothetical protein
MLVKDWGDNAVTVVKEGHISKVTVKIKIYEGLENIVL